MKDNQKFTVLKRPGGKWVLEDELRMLSAKPKRLVWRTWLHPEYLIIQGDMSPERVANIIGDDNFEHKILEGINNPELPFILMYA